MLFTCRSRREIQVYHTVFQAFDIKSSPSAMFWRVQYCMVNMSLNEFLGYGGAMGIRKFLTLEYFGFLAIFAKVSPQLIHFIDGLLFYGP